MVDLNVMEDDAEHHGGDASAGAASPTADAHETETPCLSKNQMKKQKKMEAFLKRKAAKKAAEKAAKKEHQAAKRQQIDERLADMTEEERAAHLERARAASMSRVGQKRSKKERMKQALEDGQRVVIDLGFDEQMTDTEVRSLTQQLGYSYAANAAAEAPCHLHLLGARGRVAAAMAKGLSGLDNWAVTRSEQPFYERLKDQLDKLVYLTADSPTVLEALDPDKVYIIGGIVDRNRHKKLCYNRAQEVGIATARLPIPESGMKLASSPVITVNQMVEILVGYLEHREWSGVLQRVFPARKLADKSNKGAKEAGSDEHTDEQQHAAPNEEQSAATDKQHPPFEAHAGQQHALQEAVVDDTRPSQDESADVSSARRATHDMTEQQHDDDAGPVGGQGYEHNARKQLRGSDTEAAADGSLTKRTRADDGDG